MKVFAYLKTFWEDFKAHRRGEKRVAPRNVRGRVYAREGDEPQGTSFVIKRKPTASLVMTVRRKDGTTEIIKVPAQVTEIPNG